VSFTSLQAVKVLIFGEIICPIDQPRDDYVKNPVREVKDQGMCYIAIQKLLQTDKSGVIYGCSKIPKFRPPKFGQV
jgi:hypothetical protein